MNNIFISFPQQMQGSKQTPIIQGLPESPLLNYTQILDFAGKSAKDLGIVQKLWRWKTIPKSLFKGKKWNQNFYSECFFFFKKNGDLLIYIPWDRIRIPKHRTKKEIDPFGIFTHSQTLNGTGIFTYIYHANYPNVGKYTIH